MIMETNNKHSVQNTYITLKGWLEDQEYLEALKKMEQAQKTLLRMRLQRIEDDIEPLDWDDICG